MTREGVASRIVNGPQIDRWMWTGQIHSHCKSHRQQASVTLEGVVTFSSTGCLLHEPGKDYYDVMVVMDHKVANASHQFTRHCVPRETHGLEFRLSANMKEHEILIPRIPVASFQWVVKASSDFSAL